MESGGSRYDRLARGSRAELKQAFDQGAAPEVDDLVGWEFRGWNTSWVTGLLGIHKFVKVFFESGGQAYGCNTPTAQNGLDGEWSARPSEEEPKRYAFYAVAETDGRHPNALLLDYGKGRNSFFQPARLLRDYLVRVSPDSGDLLLGKAYVALGPLRLPLTYFVVERRRPLPDEPQLPR
jgi:hypothetical protein